MQQKLNENDSFLEGKLNSLRILEAHYADLERRGLHFLRVDQILETLRTLILNLEEVFKK